LILAEKDYVSRPEIHKQGTVQWVKKLKVEELSCGHWVQLEMPEKLNDLSVQFAGGL
jgi:soluble epoxide hydrolase/lipid-phosphate phosphatase